MNHQTMKALAVLTIVLSVAASDARARPERRDPGMRWVEDLQAAIREAKDRNIPIFVAYHKDG